jgi:hypothetical protein
MDRAIHVRLGLNQTRGDERDHQLVALAEMIAARIATAALPSMARSTAGIVSPKSSLVEHAEECNLERTKSLLLGTRSLLSGQKLPCSRFEEVSQDITAAQGFVGLRAILKPVSAEAPPVNSPDSRRNWLGCRHWPGMTPLTFGSPGVGGRRESYEKSGDRILPKQTQFL